MSFISVENVNKIYGQDGVRLQALYNITMEIQQGKLYLLKGKSGSGKTTLLNIMGGLDQPTSGRIQFNNVYLDTFTENELAMIHRSQIGFIFQSFALIPNFSAFENVEFVLRLAGKSYGVSAERAQECLRMVGLGNHFQNRPNELSGGQQQRLAIARAIANKPKLILADEPTGELDSETSLRVCKVLRNMVCRENMTIFMASHSSLLNEFADQIYEIQDGVLKTD